ncbi:MAG TPA: NAD(P)/FAD-dependent oxidoreductase [Verrucomicrobiae bacterium]|nr:NAD(P)/FAD-dependent oxidoreductase [Verrucomicrobiae bacterium]
MSAPMVYDTIVIGGGPGGSTAGAFLAKAGRRVLILEKEVFPRFHIGESLLPFGNDVLKESGAWPKIEAAGFQPKHGAEFFVGNGSRWQRFWFARGLVPGYGQTFQVERARFDEVLLDHAASCGCEVREGCEAKTVSRDGDEWRIVYREGEARSRWLIDASGCDAFLTRTLGVARKPMNLPKRIAVYAHFKGVYRNPGDAEGHITIVRIKDGWFWLIPLTNGKMSVGMVRSLDDFKRFGGTVEEWFAKTIALSRELRQRMNEALQISPFYKASDYSYYHEQLATDRALLIGDAAGFIDPIFSSGVHIATKSAQLATRLICGAHAQGRALSIREQQDYSRHVHRYMDVYREMVEMYYDNRAFEVLMYPRGGLGMVPAVNSVLAGNFHRMFKVWWRVKLFHFVCAIHRRVPIVPRLDYSES